MAGETSLLISVYPAAKEADTMLWILEVAKATYPLLIELITSLVLLSTSGMNLMTAYLFNTSSPTSSKSLSADSPKVNPSETACKAFLIKVCCLTTDS